MNPEKQTFQGCKSARWIVNRRTGVGHWAKCETCLPCRLVQQNGFVGECLAEAQTSVYVMGLTLTYEDRERFGQMHTPKGAIRPDKTHIDQLLKALRRKYRVRKAYVSEYGGKIGRNHWHILLFFGVEADAVTRWSQVFSEGSNPGNVGLYAEKARTMDYAPEFVLLPIPDKQKFKRALKDPDVLVCESPSWRRTGEGWRNDWKYWPHGEVTAELLWGPLSFDPMGLNKGISYLGKYMTVDPWKGDKKLKLRPFEALPERVKQNTRYGPDEVGADGVRKVVLSKQYLKDRLSELQEKYASEDEIPIDERIYKTYMIAKNQPCLGADYFAALGRRDARFGPQHMGRDFTLPGVVKKMTAGQMARAVAKGETRQDLRGEKPRKFFMKEAGYCWYGEAYIAERMAVYGDDASDRFHQLDNVLTRRAMARERASAPFEFQLWKSARTQAKRDQFEVEWSFRPEGTRERTIPKKLHSMFKQYSMLGRWPKIRREKRLAWQEGEPKHRWQLTDSVAIIETDKGKFIYLKSLTEKVDWWRREVETVEQLEQAVQGSLLPPGAKIAQMEKEGRGDTRSIARLDVRTVRRRIAAAAGAVG